jgi:hypothetical protein
VAQEKLDALDSVYKNDADTNDSAGPKAHFSGGFFVYTDGSWYARVGGSECLHVCEDAFRLVTGASHTTLVGAETVNIQSTSDIVVDKDATETYHGNLTMTVDKGKFDETVKGNYTTTVTTGNVLLKVETGSYDMEVQEDIKIHAFGHYTRKGDKDDSETIRGRSKKFILGSSEEYITYWKNSNIAGGKTEAIGGIEKKVIGGMKWENVLGLRKSSALAYKFKGADIEFKTPEFKAKGGVAKFGTALKCLLA